MTDDDAPQTPTVAPNPDLDEIRRWVAAVHPLLGVDPQHVVELRALNVPEGRGWKKNHGGFFSCPEKLARAALRLSRAGGAVYVTLNPIDPTLLARRCNRTDVAGKGEQAGDQHITRRCWLPIWSPAVEAALESATRASSPRAPTRTCFPEGGWSAPTVASAPSARRRLCASRATRRRLKQSARVS